MVEESAGDGEVTHVELFAGIGGIGIAAEWVGFRTVAQVERDPYCLKVLEKHWPGVHRVSDIRDFPDQDYGAVTLVSGGFPCQPFSAAGKRRGKQDDRYLWPEMLRAILEIKPTWVLAENVPGILSLEQGVLFENLLASLEAATYEVFPLVLPASGVGANHRRERVFIVGHANGERRQQESGSTHGDEGQDEGRTKIHTDKLAGASQDVADTDRNNGHGGGGTLQMGRGGSTSETEKDCRFEDAQRCAKPGMGDLADGFSNWMVEPDIPRVAKGVKDRVNKLRALGNAVVPQQVYPILQAIAEVEREFI